MKEPWVAVGGWAVAPEILRPLFGDEGAVFVDVNGLALRLVDENGGLRPDWRRRAADFLASRGAGPGGCRLAGWSTGAMVAASIAPLLEPRRVALFSACGSLGWPVRALRRMKERLAADPAGVVGDFLARCRDPRDGPVDEACFKARCPVESLAAGLAFLEHYAFDPRSGRIGAPVLAFHGGDDKIVPLDAGKEFAAGIGARFTDLEGGHLFFTNGGNAAMIRGML